MTNNVFLVLFFPPPPHAGPLPVVPVVQVSTARFLFARLNRTETTTALCYLRL